MTPPPPPAETTPRLPPVIPPFTPESREILPEVSINCLGDGIAVQVSLSSKFQGVLYVKGFSRDEACRKVITGTEDQFVVRMTILYGSCGVMPDGVSMVFGKIFFDVQWLKIFHAVWLRSFAWLAELTKLSREPQPDPSMKLVFG